MAWLEHDPIHQKVAGSISDHSLVSGFKFGLRSGTYRRQPINASSFLCLSLPLSLCLSVSHQKEKENKKGVSGVLEVDAGL